ncbi:MAG: hypothetical protein J6C96_00545 [Oscillospiraceae bacterium]|nr:hypothetical protein [Oscillospiraceae bacterium]
MESKYGDIQNMLMSELTVSELVTFFVCLFIFLAIILVVGFLIIKVVDFILDLILYLIRKDKYHSRSDFLYIHALRHMARLRQQVKSAKSEKSYFLFYNRLLGAYESYVQLGLFSYNAFPKLTDVPRPHGLSIKLGVPGAGLSESARHFYSSKDDN